LCSKLEKTLQSALEAREQKLKAAGEIHKFNRDVAEALSCIAEKNAALPDGTLPKDLHSCARQLRDHEGFENDLVALESQLQVMMLCIRFPFAFISCIISLFCKHKISLQTLLDDGGRLRQEYSSNAENIQQEQQLVLEQWEELQNRAAAYKESLQNALLFHSLNNQVNE